MFKPVKAKVLNTNVFCVIDADINVGDIVELVEENDGLYRTKFSGTWGFLGSEYELIQDASAS